jgi:hypothetical protein
MFNAALPASIDVVLRMSIAAAHYPKSLLRFVAH